MYQMLYQSLNQRWSANRGCFLMSVFSSKPSMQMRCYRVEYGSCGIQNKKAAYNCASVVTLPNISPTKVFGKAKRMCKRPNFFVTHYSNNLIVHNFLMCQQVFLDFLIVCYASSKVRVAFKQPFCLSSHDFVLCRGKNTLGIPDIKRV
jgi:ABC-type maltose transport system permease subunit